jgi:hypothetical protein
VRPVFLAVAKVHVGRQRRTVAVQPQHIHMFFDMLI